MRFFPFKHPMLSTLYIILSILVTQLPTSCKKKALETIQDSNAPAEETPPSVEEPSIINPTPGRDTIQVGSSNGNPLTIDGKTLGIRPGTVIEIQEATYRTITIKNISGNTESPVIIRNDGVVTITEKMETDDIRHVIISGDGESTAEYGFRFRDVPYRAFVMSGIMDYITLKHIEFKNVTDYCISSNGGSSSLKYTGDADSRTNGFKILHCKFDNTGAVIFGGELNKDRDYGLFSDVEIAYNLFQNSNAGSLVIFANVEDFDIHHNTVDHVNAKNNDHNGIFFIQGNGHFH